MVGCRSQKSYLHHRQARSPANTLHLSSRLIYLAFAFLPIPPCLGYHHFQQPPLHLANRQNSEIPLRVTNNCHEVIYPAILTQSGFGPEKSGFRLETGDSVPQTVSADWRGRVWGRTNCTFNPDGSLPQSGQGGTACGSGDCGNFVECQGAGNPPATLAEFTLTSTTGQTFYDLSLVDGYNLPMGIIFNGNNKTNLTDIPPNLTNPVCIGTSSQLAPIGDTSDQYFGSNGSYPVPLDQTVSNQAVLNWCPWPLQLHPPQKPGDGVYPYPDDNILRPPFNPCLSACAKWNSPQYCCTDSYDSPDRCRPSYYSTQAKMICPDAYSYAFDDQTSTFIVPEGGGFEVVFCPGGRSSNILKVFGSQLRQVAQSGLVSKAIDDLAQNRTYIQQKNGEPKTGDPSPSLVALIVLLVWMCLA